MQSVALLGLGNMGAGMARRLLKAGFALTVYNRTRARAEALAADGAAVAVSPREAAEHADIVISMVADDNASRGAWMGDTGALAGARAGAILIESSTLSVAWVKTLAAAASTKGCAFLEAPVTGSKAQAESGELLFLAAGDAATLDSMRPVLAAMSRGVVHLGPIGSGATMKLVNNFVCGVQTAALAEAMATIENSGLNRDQALDVLCNGAPGSPLVKGVSRRMAERDYRVNFALQLMLKDLTYALAEGARHGVSLHTAQAALDVFRAAAAAGLGDKDMAAVVEPYRGSIAR
ncbi:MAG TPA: NAD(P)-dependent oxidoreductase [Bryobacteraceae bacterium]|nr:NAD(P)-dependent oxidoreductase [Bryobacteraceae bacterium]